MDKNGSVVRFVFVVSLLITGGLYVNSAEAGMSLTAEIAEKQVKHDYKDSSAPDATAIFRGDIGTIIIGVNYNQGRFFSSINLEQSWKDDIALLNNESILFLDRTDYALTFGYAVFERMSVFVGYKYGETSIYGIDVGIDAGTPGYNDLAFIDEGPFLGISYSQPVTDKSVLGFSLAYADMDAETENRIDPYGGPGAGPASATGSVDGLSTGIKWSYELSESTLLNIGYKLNSYDAEGTNMTGDDYTLESDYEFVTFGLRHYF
ncbi:MAG: hypothetical protein IME93_04070 [Proteobacteria bacterium]|nr:hypothetical protein [Pseudomonadota bacterium]